MNNPSYNSGNQMYQGRNPILSSNPAVNILKTIGSSGKFLAAAIFVTVDVLISICATFMGSAPLENMSSMTGIYSEYYSSGYNIGMILEIAMSVVAAIGIWITYLTCKSTTSGGISTSGLTICKVICIILACLMGLAIAAFLIVAFAMIFVGGDVSYDFGYYGYYLYSFGAIIFIIVAAIFLLAMLYYIFLAKTISRIKATAETGVPDNRISSLVIVLSWIVGILGALIGVLSLFGAPISGLANIANAMAYIFFAIILSNYKSQMSVLMSGYNVTSYAQPQANLAGVYTPPAQQPNYQQPTQQPSYQQPTQQSYQQPTQQQSYQAPEVPPEAPKAPDIDSAEVQKQAASEVEDWLNTPPAQADRPESDDKDGGSDIQ